MQSKLPGVSEKRSRPPRAADKEPLQVRIPAIVKRRFKAEAAIRGMEPNQLFVEVWDHYERTALATTSRQGEKSERQRL